MLQPNSESQTTSNPFSDPQAIEHIEHNAIAFITMNDLSNTSITLLSLAVLVAGGYLLYRLAKKYVFATQENNPA